MVQVKDITQGLDGMIIYVNTDEPGSEKPHVHIAKGGRKKKGDLKWLIEESDFDKKSMKGFPKHKLNKLRAVLTIYREECMATWTKIFGEKQRLKRG